MTKQADKSNFRVNRNSLKTAVILAMVGVTHPVIAQQSESAESDIEEVVVTGTMIRGGAPVGSPISSVDRQEIESTNVATMQDIGRLLPNTSNSQANKQGSMVGSSYFAPTIHSLGSSASNSTLVLIDSHRIPLGNTSHPLPDPSIVPTIAVDRVEVVADGASATYGSDAVAGVVNYITRDSYDGFMMTGQHGYGDDYDTQDYGVLWGTDWGDGSVMTAYNYSYKSNLPGTARSFLSDDQRPRGGTNFMGRACEPATIQPEGSSDVYRSATASSPLDDPFICEDTYSDHTGDQLRHNAMVKLNHQFSDRLTVSADLLYSYRNNTTRQSRGTIQGTAFGSGPQANPFYENPPGVTADSQTVRLRGDELFGPGARSNGIGQVGYGTLELEYELSPNFTLTAFGMAGRTLTESIGEGGINSARAYLALNGTTNGGGNPDESPIPGSDFAPTNLPLTEGNALDLWRPADSNRTSQEVLDSITEPYDTARVFQTIQQGRLILDGTLFDLPTGGVQGAFGIESVKYGVEPETVDPNGTGQGAYEVFNADISRDVDSYFGEILVPIIGAAQDVPLVESFDLNLSVRRDEYDSFGSTTNPKIGFDWQMTEDFKLRGSVSESFVAPPMSSSAELYTFSHHGTDGRRISVPIEFFPQAQELPGCENETEHCVVGAGTPRTGIRRLSSDTGLEPQTGESWSIGFDYAPLDMPGRFSLTRFSNKFRGGVTSPNPNMLVNTPSLHPKFTIFPDGATQEQLEPLIADTPQGSELPSDIYFFNNQDQANIVNLDIRGFDLQGEYTFNTDDMGQFTVGGSATYFTQFDQFFGEGGEVFSVLNTQGFNQTFSSVELQARGNFEWSRDNLTARLFAYYTPSHTNWGTNALNPIGSTPAGNPDGTGGDPVDSFLTWDFNLSYSFAGSELLGGALSNSDVYLDIQNVLDEDPPFYNDSDGYGPYNANPLGRVVSVGLRYRF